MPQSNRFLSLSVVLSLSFVVVLGVVQPVYAQEAGPVETTSDAIDTADPGETTDTANSVETIKASQSDSGAGSDGSEQVEPVDCQTQGDDKTPGLLADDDWREKIKNPTPWLTWGGDLRLREIYINNAFTFDKEAPGHEWHRQRVRTRLWTTIKPTDDFEFNLRIAWEGKNFDKPEAREPWQPTSVLADRLNFKWKDIGGSPFTLKAGRQDLMLGDRWLVMDGTPLDGSSTMYFDAVRLTMDLEDIQTKVDFIYLEQDAEGEHWFHPIYNEHRLMTEQDETGAIVWVTNNSLAKTQLDGYFIYKKSTPAAANGDLAELYTFGARADHAFNDQWKLRGNFAAQFGRKNEATVCAFGALTRLAYDLNDDWKSSIRVDYEYLSGDDPDTNTNEAFDILWGRYPRVSELHAYNYAGETRIGDMTNFHRVSAGWTGHPNDKTELCADYHLLFADQNTYGGQDGFSQGGCFRGQLLTSQVKYRFTDYLCGRFTGELFFPGDYYTDDRNDVAAFLRAQLEFSW